MDIFPHFTHILQCCVSNTFVKQLTAQAVSCWLLIMEAHDEFQGSPREIYNGQSATGAGFSHITLVFVCQSSL